MFIDKYPYTDFHELNLDWILKQIKELNKTMEEFVTLNTLVFADPLLWDITTSYAKNTIVLDMNGNAYLSTKIVPAGVLLSDTDYWTEIFDFTAYVTKSNKNLTIHFEYNTDVATANYNVDDWLIWEEVLYKVLVPITAGDLLQGGVNIEHFTVEQFIKDFVTATNTTILNYKNAIDYSELQYKNEIDASELAYRNQLAQDITNTTNSLQNQLDLAISGVTVDSEVINARVGWDGTTFNTLGDAVRQQFKESIKSSKIYVTDGTQHPIIGEYLANTIYLIAPSAIPDISDSPYDKGFFTVMTFSYAHSVSPYGGELQIAFPTFTDTGIDKDNIVKYRSYNGANWNDWTPISDHITYVANPSNFIDVIDKALRTPDSVVQLQSGDYYLFDAGHDEAYWIARRPATRYTGLLLYNNIKLIGTGRTRFYAQYSGSDSDIMENFSIFNIGGYCEIHNIECYAQNICYVIHDDPAIIGQYGTDCIFNRMDMTHYGSTHSFLYGAPICIGGGVPSSGYSNRLIEHCSFWSVQNNTVSYHTASGSDGKILFNDNNWRAGGLVLADMGGGTFLAKVSNNKLTSITADPVVTLQAWNNS